MATVGDLDPVETQEWVDSLDYILREAGKDRAIFILKRLQEEMDKAGHPLPFTANTAYVNTIPVHQEPKYPGNIALEKRIRSLVRWNAMAMVVRANRVCPGIGGHISTFASLAMLLDVGFNHFFRASSTNSSGDQVYFQGHASPGIYARAFLEGRLSEQQLENFRRELQPGGGLSSYPHPWLMPNFWQFPTVSMGLGPLMGIYQARFNRYLEQRGLLDTSQSKVWVFVGDGETDEPESMGSLTLPTREKLDNLIFVINCNLQRLDGPVRGNGKVIQELEAAYRGAGWNVIKLVWGADWDPLLEKDQDGLLRQRMSEVVDGWYQKYSVESGPFIREHFFGANPELLSLVEHLTDENLPKLRRGGHDLEKIFAAYHAAVKFKGAPTVILAKTIKGYGLGEAGEGRNVTHQQKKLNEEELKNFRSRLGIELNDEEVGDAPYFKPSDDSDEIRYLHERRKALGGYLPNRGVKKAPPLKTPDQEVFKEFFEGSGEREVSTTMAFVQIFNRLLRHKEIGKLIVPIVPDEARTFGMESLFRQYGIYASQGQLYEPVDSKQLLYYREAKDGQILEEGINEAGSMASFIAAGTAYSTHGINTIPFYIFYSMFGFQRIGDLIWAAGDMRSKGFLLGGTSGRTTLNGEGLQHQDGHSHLLATTVPNLVAYDPAFAYEIAVIIQDGIRRMYEKQEDVFYYITLGNENYAMPPMKEHNHEGILKGIYKFQPGPTDAKMIKAHLFGSGSLITEALRAQTILAERYQVSADVWSVTSYKELRRDALEVDRWNRLHPLETPKVSYIESILKEEEGPFVAVSDYMKLVAEQITPWVPGGLIVLGTDGFGRSDSRSALRRFFEVDAECMTLATLDALRWQNKLDKKTVQQAITDLNIDPEKDNPLTL
ncbi:pyruvate dehydrogenase (acetyl-transferring), homodimeric type [Candidatus Nitronereus thalassa]|uniref:Pyruvate dehydrogenase E1 component n=2 Tax=Candidatus Nitronereus thalassa TaxID=3020898 RepID=A0ABU3KD02_9BACT|nr:pyruvate dehydrogenase (acetyl-transferring), homodimeric type [Candidatus Nitronereus thalassa]MDT7044295.1 pyruvate dehydrogenase (acetyl-transferring), homodimeric type [Candidatus Nitronereus thalassa]